MNCKVLRISRFRLVICMFLVAISQNVYAQTWTVTRLLHDTSQSIGHPDVEAFHDQFLLAYPCGSAGSSVVDYRIYALRSADGIDWRIPQFVRDVPGNNPFCDVAIASDGHSFVSWHRMRPDGSAFDIWLARELSEDYWETEQVTDDSNDDKRSQIAVFSDDSIAIVFPRHMPAGEQGDKDIAVASFNGSSWDIEMLTENGKGDHRPVVTVDSSDTMHILYAGYVGEGKGNPTMADWNLFYTNNANGSWSPRLNLTDELDLPTKSDWPSIVIDSNDVLHCLCAAGASEVGEDREMYYLSNANGVWSKQKLGDHDRPCEWCSLTIDSEGALYGAYQAGRVFNQSGKVPTDIYYIERQVGGHWSPPVRIDNPWDDSERPSIAVNENKVVTIAYWAKIQGANQLVVASSDRGDAASSIDHWRILK